jgi:hypothetical protein
LDIENLVKEWKSSDEVVKSVESRRHKVLAVVAEELKGGKHGQTSVCKKMWKGTWVRR